MRQERQQSKGRQLPWAMIAAVLGGIVVIGVIAYAVIQTTASTDAEPGWLKAELNDDPNIPGVYVAPHPGADGVFDSGTNPELGRPPSLQPRHRGSDLHAGADRLG